MAAFGFTLMAIVAVILKQELLTMALLIWGLAIVGRFMLRHYMAANQPQMGRSGRD